MRRRPKVVYSLAVSSLAQIGSTQRHRPMVGSALCMAASGRSIRLRCSKENEPGYNQTEDGRAHNAADVGSIPTPGTNTTPIIAGERFHDRRTAGEAAEVRNDVKPVGPFAINPVAFGQTGTRPDQFSRLA